MLKICFSSTLRNCEWISKEPELLSSCKNIVYFMLYNYLSSNTYTSL